MDFGRAIRLVFGAIILVLGGVLLLLAYHADVEGGDQTGYLLALICFGAGAVMLRTARK